MGMKQDRRKEKNSILYCNPDILLSKPTIKLNTGIINKKIIPPVIMYFLRAGFFLLSIRISEDSSIALFRNNNFQTSTAMTYSYFIW